MLFNSLIFLFFAVIFFGLWPTACRSPNRRYGFIVLASFVFYGWVNPVYILLLLLTGLVDFAAGLAMERYPLQAKNFLLSSLFCNLGVLGVFKYSAFATENLNAVCQAFHFALRLEVVHFLLPVGISFYTFQSINYSISVYRKDIKPTHNLLHFFSFISLFPHLVAGPLVRAADILPQLERAGMPSPQERWSGIRLIAKGYFKKTVIADNLALPVQVAFGDVHVGSSLYWWVAVTMFAFQIYCDFSGYSDIACGLARFLRIDFGENFNAPYCSTSFREFWQRWHISLSTWFRDYVYIPLGGSRGGPWKVHTNLWVTMLISALWHGANWTFIIWGALHALYLSIERLTGLTSKLQKSVPIVGIFLAWLLVFGMVCVAWVFFRAEGTPQALAILSHLTSVPMSGDLALLPANFGARSLMILSLCLAWEWSRLYGVTQALYPRVAFLEPVAVGLLLTASIFLRGPGHTFIYFQF